VTADLPFVIWAAGLRCKPYMAKWGLLIDIGMNTRGISLILNIPGTGMKIFSDGRNSDMKQSWSGLILHPQRKNPYPSHDPTFADPAPHLFLSSHLQDKNHPLIPKSTRCPQSLSQILPSSPFLSILSTFHLFPSPNLSLPPSSPFGSSQSTASVKS
jgi:hypothetical protein